MKKLVLGMAVSMFLCVSSASGHEGYCDRGLYIPTHVIECVTFCKDRGRVLSLSGYDPIECRCGDDSIKAIPPDPQDPQCPEVPCGVECNE